MKCTTVRAGKFAKTRTRAAVTRPSARTHVGTQLALRCDAATVLAPEGLVALARVVKAHSSSRTVVRASRRFADGAAVRAGETILAHTGRTRTDAVAGAVPLARPTDRVALLAAEARVAHARPVAVCSVVRTTLAVIRAVVEAGRAAVSGVDITGIAFPSVLTNTGTIDTSSVARAVVSVCTGPVRETAVRRGEADITVAHAIQAGSVTGAEARAVVRATVAGWAGESIEANTRVCGADAVMGACIGALG